MLPEIAIKVKVKKNRREYSDGIGRDKSHANNAPIQGIVGIRRLLDIHGHQIDRSQLEVPIYHLSPHVDER